MAATTITIDAAVRDRLKGYGGGSYNDKLTRLMDMVEEDAFVATLRRELDEPTRWQTIDWNDPIWD